MTSEKKFLIIAMLFALVALTVIFLSGTVFLPVFIALILTYILNPLVAKLTERG